MALSPSKVVLVRRCETKEILGLFWGYSEKTLWWMVDGTGVDPSDYEFAIVRNGMLHFRQGEGEMPVPFDFEAADENEAAEADGVDWAGAKADESDLWDVMHGHRRPKWKRLPFCNQPGGGLYEIRQEIEREKA